MQLTVDVADADVIQVEQRNLAHPTASHGFRRPGTDTTDTNDRHMGSPQSLQPFDAIQAGDAGKPRIFCTHDHYLKNRRVLYGQTVTSPTQSGDIAYKSMAISPTPEMTEL
ncbi:hypothetical protein D3C85_1160740 [compost metagenome]